VTRDDQRGRLHGLVVLLVVVAALLFSMASCDPPRAVAEAPPESPGCETYGCLYEHCHHERTGERCEQGIAYQRLPDGPDNRRYVRVLWPDHYQPDRRPLWDDVAYCESTWRWDYAGAHDGGLQFASSTWQAYGGGTYAARAGLALPEEQISIAERVAYYGWVRPDGSKVEPQGPRAWPSCGRGLVPPA
jgi:hypothetical protein